MFDDWYLGVLKVWGDKQSEINACFAHCEYYTYYVLTEYGIYQAYFR
jgi:hypothetical protein